jgi:putative nucleotidyltransferase with HDIG domain
MFSSVLSGISALSPGVEAFFILPADIPLVKPCTYAAIDEAFRKSIVKPDVVYPSFMGERAHPPLVSSSMIEPILSWHGAFGLHGFFRERAHAVLDVPIFDRASLLDMDTPEDYNRLLAYAKTEFYPDDDECAELLRIANTPERVVRHTRVVANCAMLIADAMSKTGAKIDLRLLRSAALLHDISKGEHDHEARGANWLRNRGYVKASEIVASHKDLPARKKVGEAEILYLADKMTDGTTLLSLESRLTVVTERFQAGSEALEGARRRMASAVLVRKKVEDATGMSIEEILGGADIERWRH